MKWRVYVFAGLLLVGLVWSLLPREDAGALAPRPGIGAGTRGESTAGTLDSDTAGADDVVVGGRVVIEGPAEAPAPGSPPLELAKVRVTVIDDSSGVTLEGVSVRIEPTRPSELGEAWDGRALYAWMEAQGWGTLEGTTAQPYLVWGAQAPRSNGRGLCLLDWPVGVPFSLIAGEPERDMGWVRRDEDGLTPDEVRTVTLEVPVGADYVFHGRVLGAATGQPIAGAELFLLADGWRADPTVSLAPEEARHGDEYLELVTRSDDEGRFSLGGRSWKLRPLLQDETVLVVAEGFGPSIVGATPANGTLGRELTIRLETGAQLGGHVTGGVASGQVELRCKSGAILAGPSLAAGEKALWTTAWEQDGAFQLVDLPPRVMLEVRLRLDSGEVLYPSRALTLQARERRVVEWVLGDTATVKGVVVDEHGEPVSGVPVAASAVVGAPPPSLGDGLIDMFGAGELAAQGETDAQGRFDFAGLGPGTWAVGVVTHEYPPNLDVSMTGTLVEILEGAREVEARVVVFRELSIEGIVLGPGGKPLAGALMSATRVVGQGFAEGVADDEGRFKLSPLAPGVYDVGAWVPQAPFYFPRVEVEAGARDAVVKARAAGGLRGRVFRADGTPAPRVRLLIDIPGAVLASWVLRTRDGRFEFDPLPIGSYDIIVSSPAGDALILNGRVVGEGVARELSDIYLEPAGRVFLKSRPGAAKERATLRAGGAQYRVDLWPDQTAILTLPPGSHGLELPLSPVGGPGRRIELVVRVGEDLRVDLD
jgi:hypothetical protein